MHDGFGAPDSIDLMSGGATRTVGRWSGVDAVRGGWVWPIERAAEACGPAVGHPNGPSRRHLSGRTRVVAWEIPSVSRAQILIVTLPAAPPDFIVSVAFETRLSTLIIVTAQVA